MLRAFRCEANQLDSFSLKYAAAASDLLPYLKRKVGSDSVSLLAIPVMDKGYVNYYTELQGRIESFDPACFTAGKKQSQVSDETAAGAFKLWQERKNTLLSFLQGNNPDAPSELLEIKDELLKVIAASKRCFLIEKKEPLILPLRMLDDAALPPYKSMPAKGAPAAGRQLFSPLLPILFLLALALALFLWWFFLKPWPFDAGFETKEPHENIPTTQPSEFSHPQKPKINQPDELRPENKELPVKTYDEEKSKPTDTAQPVKAELVKAKTQEIKQDSPLNKEAASKIAAKPKEQSKIKTETKAVLPKCTLLKREGKMPQLAIAFDGSGSMMREDVRSSRGNSSRLSAAVEAAHNLIPSIDKNVNIGFIEINGCPVSKNHGFFDYANRSKLLYGIDSINPLKYDQKTPLVHALNELSSMVDGKNADAVGILISDGEDTCPFTEKMDVCEIARRIHQKQPRLKIHAILLGEDAYKASCIAVNTGGKVFSPKDAAQISSQIKAAASSMQKVCKE